MPKGIVTRVDLLLDGGHRVSIDKEEEGRARGIMANPSRPEIVDFALESGGEIAVYTKRIVGIAVS